MINKTSDKNIINVIKYSPIVMMLCFAFVMGVFIFQENKSALERDIKGLSSALILEQRALLKDRIDELSRQVSYEKNTAMEQLESDLKERLYEAYHIAQSIYQNNNDLTKVELKQRIKNALREVRFNDGRGYFFAITLDGVSELFPFQPNVEGRSVIDVKSANGTMLFQEMIELMKVNDESSYQWWFPKPDSGTNAFLKIGYIKRFEPLEWFIGTGEYLTDFEAILQKNLLNKMHLSRSNNRSSYYIVDGSLDYISHSNQEFIGQNAKSSTIKFTDTSSLSSTGLFIDSDDEFTDENGLLTGNITYVSYNKEWKWTLVGTINFNEFNQYFIDRKAMLENENDGTLFKVMMISSILTLLLTSFSFLVSHNTARRFKSYQHHILKNMKKLEKNEEQMNFLAYHDPLTRLPNRRALEETINKEILICQQSNTQMAIMFFDLDDFKKINDHYGHGTGDALLVVLGKEFNDLLGPLDRVFRFGGDEFIFCFPQLKNISQAIDKVNKIQHVFNEEIEVTGNKLHIRGSIGIATYPNDASTASELIRKADLVLYKSKVHKKGDHLFYDQTLEHQLERSLVIETQLRTALSDREFTMVYQPQICAESGKIIGVEALIRWENKVLGNVPPGEFIGVAENVGLINQLGDFVIEQSCRDIAQYNRDNDMPISLSINVSPVQLLKTDFVECICKITHESGLANSYVTIEITENVLISEIDSSRSVIESLREHGFKISLDDFGTGYSSLSYLNKLPINEIKIDRSFMLELLESKQSLSLVKSIILIAESCSMSVVAEGVETQEQFEKLQELGCDIIQGYYFSKPLRVEDLTRIYKSLIENI